MECGQCGASNRSGARFCGTCGSQLTRHCAACAAELDPRLKFCDECGTPATAPDGPTDPAAAADSSRRVAVRKTVTVVFCDLGGSTSFGERTDAEVTREVMARYHALLQAVIDAHGGRIAKFMGDGMMATFGIPEIAEDDAIRAVHAGVDVQRRFAEFTANLDAQHRDALTLRVGVNTGEVVIAEGDADLIGDTLNVAARLERACRPGHVLVGEETWRLTRGAFGYESLGEVTVAGREEPVAIFEVASGGSTTVETASPFVGRDPEMQRLRAVFDSASASRSARLVTVLGSAGVGKTRLSRELCAVVEADANAITFEVRCDRAGDATFAPVAQLIREATGLGDDADAEMARSRVGTLLAEDEPDRARLAAILAGLVGAARARSVEETFWAIRRLVTTVAARRPMVVVVDDIQWAEPLLLDLLEHLAEWVQDVPVVLLGLARPELRDVRPSLAERGRHVEDVLALDGLDSVATEQLAAGLLGADHLPVGLVARLPASTDGNPLFVRELVRMLVDDRVIRRRGGEWELAIDADAVEVPPTIQSLLATRVERLPGDERLVLELASVVGAEFSLGALRDLAGPDTPVDDLLESMRRKELVEPTGTYWGDEPVHRFHHVLIRDSAYRRLLKTTRAELHERVAIWTDQAALGLIGEHEAVIAFHYEQAYQYRQELGSVDEHAHGLGRRAAELLSTAADRALGRDDLAAAGALGHRALVLLPETEAGTRAALLLIACECLLASGDVAAARPVVERLTAVAGSDAALGAWAASFEAQLIGLTDPDGLVRAEVTATSAAAVMEELGDGAGAAKAHQVRAGLLARLGRVGDAEMELHVALDAARGVDDRRRVTAVLGAAPVAALWGPSPVARAGGRSLDVVRLLRITTASPSVEATSMRCQAVLEALRGRFDVARSMLGSARATLEELGLRHGLYETEYLAGVVELIADDPAAAIEPLRTAYRGLGEMGVGVDAGRAAALLARALLAQGRVDEAEPMAAASEALAGQDLKTAIAWRVAKAEVLAARGELAAGIALAQDAVEIAAATDLVIDHADACVALAGLRDAAGDNAGARAARADAVRLYDAKGATVPAVRLAGRGASGPPAPVASVGSLPSEPSAPPLEPRSRTDRAENVSTRRIDRFVALFSARQLDEAAALIAGDHVQVDRRSTSSGAILRGRDEFVDSMRATLDVGFTNVTAEALAVRGDRLALSRFWFGANGGREQVTLGVTEIDSQGLGAYLAWFDEDALGAAQDELDERYLAGEGAVFGDLGLRGREFQRALSQWDIRRLRELTAPEMVLVDRRELGWPELDRDAYIELQRSYAEALSFRPITLLTRTVHVVGRAVLSTMQTRADGSEGASYEWEYHALSLPDDTGLVLRIELFDRDDFDAALARLDELGAVDHRHPRAENAAVRVITEVNELTGPWDESPRLFADDLVFHDRRRVVGMPASGGRDDVMAMQRVSTEFGLGHATSISLAVRGDRLSLHHATTRTTEDYELAYLVVVEINEEQQVAAVIVFDDDALDDAVDELDARYLEGEGAALANVATPSLRSLSWFHRRDWHGHLEAYAPDFVCVDRRELGWPTLDRDGLASMLRGYVDLVPDITILSRTLHVNARAGLTTLDGRGHGVDGSDYEWSSHSLSVFDSSGRISRTVLYPEADFATALAHLDELGVKDPESTNEPAAPLLDNQVTRAIRVVFGRGAAGSFDLSDMVTDDVVRFDTRRAVSTPTLHGRAEFEDNLRAIYDVFDSGAIEPIAIRGERVALMRVNLSREGFAATMLGVYETNEEGLLSCGTSFDEDDLVEAVAELERRYFAGEGAPDEAVLAPAAEIWRLYNARDWDGMRELCADGFDLIDHRLASAGTVSGPDEVIEYVQALVELAPDALVVDRYRLAVGRRCVLSAIFAFASTPEGSYVEFEFLALGTIDKGAFASAETFPAERVEEALARFQEIEDHHLAT